MAESACAYREADRISLHWRVGNEVGEAVVDGWVLRPDFLIEAGRQFLLQLFGRQTGDMGYIPVKYGDMIPKTDGACPAMR